MRNAYYFSIKDILLRKYFEHAKVIAGHGGLHHQVKWVHVVEVTSIKNLLNGNELILTTGLGLKEEENFLSLVKQLIECDASALCIELDTNISTIPQSVLQLADLHDFPIVVFEQEVPFVSITQDIHSVIINQQYDMIKKLDLYGQELNKKLLNVNHFREILQVLHNELDVPIFFQVRDHKEELYSSMNPYEEKKLRGIYKKFKQETNHCFASKKVILFDQEYAEVLIYRNNTRFSEYDLLILDRTSIALAQYLMRELYFKEQKRIEESKWIMSWLKGEQTTDRIAGCLSELKFSIHGGVVCIGHLINSKEKENKDLTYLFLVARNIFEQQGFQVLTEMDEGNLVFILLDTRKNKDWKNRIKNAFERIRESSEVLFAIGKYQEEMMNIHLSFQTAKESLFFRSKIKGNQGYYFFDDLHLYRLISIVNNNVNLWEMIEEYLDPILQYDEDHDGSLLKTLKVFFNCQGSKQQTAKRLYIVRQTLYHRLKKIEELLGEDFMKPDQRVALEFLLAAHDYLMPLRASKRVKIN